MKKVAGNLTKFTCNNVENYAKLICHLSHDKLAFIVELTAKSSILGVSIFC